MTRAIIVDDHALVRSGLKRFLEQALPDIDFCGEAGTEADGFALAEDIEPDLALLDLTLTEGHGLGLVRRIKELNDTIKVLVYSGHSERVYAVKALQAGASGYVMKDAEPETLVRAINHVLEGKRWFSQTVLNDILDEIADGPENRGVRSLSETELKVFELVADGLSNQEAAHELGYPNAATVNTHMRNIKRKLNCKSFAEVRHYAVIWLYGGDDDPSE